MSSHRKLQSKGNRRKNSQSGSYCSHSTPATWKLSYERHGFNQRGFSEAIPKIYIFLAAAAKSSVESTWNSSRQQRNYKFSVNAVPRNLFSAFSGNPRKDNLSINYRNMLRHCSEFHNVFILVTFKTLWFFSHWVDIFCSLSPPQKNTHKLSPLFCIFRCFAWWYSSCQVWEKRTPEILALQGDPFIVNRTTCLLP